MNETNVINEFATLIAQSKLDARNRWSGNILEHLRNEYYLDDYERGSFAFEEYLADILSENFYDVDLIDYSTEKYDHKRGFTTLTAQVEIPYSNFIEVKPLYQVGRFLLRQKMEHYHLMRNILFIIGGLYHENVIVADALHHVR